ncbi:MULTISPECIES: hypothetical protein [unclassified Streptomyces]|uniref:hypothetical protein n=1 Tax=unclassified Streptomyces TaxID=2593676 RepID=UPI0023ED9EB7|nr:hypothetical protein [Streptomyces sp. WMMB303]MDF4248809.1 hypothetical protein [Streptomyces sp. WMMB303]
MPWWALIAIAWIVAGPAALYAMTRHRRRTDQALEEADSRYEELSRKYTALLEKSASGELPGERERHPEA